MEKNLTKKSEFKTYFKGDEIEKPLQDLFELKCKKCKSKNIDVVLDSEMEGYESTGFYSEASLMIKCKSCGNTKIYTDDWNGKNNNIPKRRIEKQVK